MNLLERDIRDRIERFKKLIISMEGDAALITSSVNQYWLCGIIFSGYLYIDPEEKPLIFYRRPVNLSAKNAIAINKPEQIPDLLRDHSRYIPKRLLVESDQLSLSSATRLRTAMEMPELTNLSQQIRTLRSVKSEYELNLMRESAEIHCKVYEHIPSIYKRGMIDLEFQIEIERVMRLHGSIGIFRAFGDKMDIFMGSILAGSNAEVPSPYDYSLGGAGISPLLPIGANNTPLMPGSTLMVDMAGNFRPYMDDITRTFAIEHAPDFAYKTHQVSIDIHRAVEDFAGPGTAVADIYNLAYDIVKHNGLEPYFMGTKQQAKFIGHGLGLEINEPPVITPRSKEILKPGMAFALEPKFVLPDVGAVGIENSYIVGEAGLENISLCSEELTALK